MRVVPYSPRDQIIKVDLQRVPMIGESVEIGNSAEGGAEFVVTNVVTYTYDGEIYVILDRRFKTRSTQRSYTHDRGTADQ